MNLLDLANESMTHQMPIVFYTFVFDGNAHASRKEWFVQMTQPDQNVLDSELSKMVEIIE
jgi:uncharacterized protein involved in tellurium resistance